MNRLDQPVDLVDIARRTTQADLARREPGSVKVIAPAKINAVFRVGPRRADGYHEVRNVMQALMMHDVLYMWPLSETGAVTCDCVPYEDVPAVDVPAEDNLAVRAVRALAADVFGGEDAAPGVGIRIEKHIPAQAGLGGGSADAAAALVGAAKLWQAAGVATEAQTSPEALARVAATLGADVPFFLQGGAALYTGTGTELAQTLPTRKDSVVVIRPDAGLSTAAVYAAFDELTAAENAESEEGAEGAESEAAENVEATAPESAPAFDAAPGAFADAFANLATWQNDLQAPAIQQAPEVGRILDWLATQPGVEFAQMTGSGSAVFAICASFSDASKLAGSAKLKGWWARSTMFGPARAAVVPTE